MGTSAFYWYPDPDGTLEKTALSRLPSALSEQPLTLREDARAMSGRRISYLIRRGLRVRVVFEGLRTASVIRELRTMESHLQAGGVVGFTADDAKAWCAYLKAPPARGDTTIYTGGNVFHTAGSGTVANNETMVLEGLEPGGQHEVILTAASLNSIQQIVTVAPVTYPWPTLAALWLRHQLYFPIMYLPPDQLNSSILTSDHRRVWTLDLTLEMDLGMMAAVVTVDRPIVNASETVYQAGLGGFRAVPRAVEDATADTGSGLKGGW